MMSRRPLFFGNWKMHKTASEAQHYLTKLLPSIKDHTDCVRIATPYTCIRPSSKIVNNTSLLIGSQNVSHFSHGAYTGEISAEMIKDSGAKFSLVGHSERRTIFHETSTIIKEKILRLFDHGIFPVLCIGESKEQRDSHKTAQVLEEQLLGSLEQIPLQQMLSIIIAYEPIWAIGTGVVATPGVAEETHGMIRKILTKNWGNQVQSIPILYGGSVKPENTKELISQPNIDGVLVGGASLEAHTFAKIILEGLKA